MPLKNIGLNYGKWVDTDKIASNSPGKFIVVQDEHGLWHWRLVNGVDKELYTSAHSWISKDDAIMVGQSYGHVYKED